MEIRQTEIIIIQGSFRSQTSNQSATKTSPYYFKKKYKKEKEEIKNLLYALHHSTYRNEQQIKNSKDCGCFHCKTIFKPEDVTEWCDNDGRGDRTGRCPNCRMDSVLGDNSGVDITPDLLELMKLQFFGPGIDHVNVTVSNSNQTEESNEHNN